jgi:4-amino-4-deoxy-L-arabinose transferase-like glycosyltransferase
MLFAFAMAGVVSRTVFERLPHLEDEMAYLFQARTLARGALVVESPVPARPYWQPFIVDRDGVRFGKYTIGYPAQLAIGVWLGELWVVNGFAAALAVAVTCRIGRIVGRRVVGRRTDGRDTGGWDTGLIAAALVATSPAALLLNGTLMGHTGALACTGLFAWACWQIAYGRSRAPRALLGWGVLGGLALGLLVASRPLTALGIAAPFALWGVWAAVREPRLLRGFVPLGLLTGLLALSIPIYNYAATGDPTANLYTLVWEYDRIGFGEGAGRNVHTWEKGVRHTRFDLSLTAADLFGLQAEPLMVDGMIRPELYEHFTVESDYYPVVGLSWIPLLLGLVAVFRWRAVLVLGWLALGVATAAIPFHIAEGEPSRNPTVGYLLLLTLVFMLAAPGALLHEVLVTGGGTGPRRAAAQARIFAWLLCAGALMLVVLHLAYWVGSQRYSTRYYYEGLIAAAVIAAAAFAWLAGRQIGRVRLRPFVYAGTAALLVFAHYSYSIPRVASLYGYNLIDRTLLEGVEARREGDRPVLAIINGETRWRAYAELAAQTSPFLDSPIVAARAATPAEREAILARFGDRQIIELDGIDNEAWFRDNPPDPLPTPLPR